MATVTGLTAARMQQIINAQISSGAIDLSGKLIFTRVDGSTFDAGTAKGAKGDPAVYDIAGFPSSNADVYVKLATLDGVSATAGAHVQFMLGGIGNYGTGKRATVLVHVAQRGADNIDVKTWTWGLDQAAAFSFRIYTRKMGTYLYEVWARYGNYTADPTYMDISKWNATLNLNGNTTTAPTPLVESVIEPRDLAYATPDDIMAGLNNNQAISPKDLRDAGGGDPPGVICQYAGTTAPTGYLLCRGQAVSRTTYARLFAVIGTTYGAGDGSTTFNLPNLQGRVPVGLLSTDTQFDALGETGGAKTHTLSEAEMPSHQHDFGGQTFIWGTNIGSVWISGTQANGGASPGSGNPMITYQDIDGWADTYNTGGGGAHNNLQPYIVVNYIIKI